ncbi:MAG: 1-acyl-sn-glycerol-3-phosphate acyltransferase, partial [Crocosphaera sp.]
IKRATEGVAYAQNPVIKQAIQEGLKNLETIAQGTFERRLHGGFRRLFLRSLIHTLFQVRVEYTEGSTAIDP